MAGCTPAAREQVEVIRPVKTLVVAEGEDAHVRTFSGTVEAARRAELGFQVPGLLVEFPVKEGEQVAKGAMIAQLRTEEFQARLQSLTGQLDQARAALAALRMGERPEEQRRREAAERAAVARLANARAEFERHAQLLPSRAVSRAAYDQAQAAYQVATEELRAARELLEKGTIGRDEDIQARAAEVRGLEARVVEANIQLDDTTLKAPYDGVIAQRFVEVGQSIRANDPIVRFQDVEEVEIIVDVPESVMAVDIRTADIISLTAELSGAPGVQIPVTLREIAQVADPVTQTFKVRCAMQVPEGIQALPGMTATVTATYRRAQILGRRILVPVSAVHQPAGGEPTVWIIGTDNRAAARPVTLGSVVGGQVEIASGLQPGDRIAVAGVTVLRDGMTVRDLGDALGTAAL